MSNFTSVSIQEIANYLRLDGDNLIPAEILELTNILNSAREFIRAQTGLTDPELDSHADFVIALYILCQHQYDIRSYVIEKDTLNPYITAVLAAHSVNYL
jgi:hypothetical protein